MKKYYPPKPKPISLTKKGLQEAQEKYAKLTKEREEILVRLQTAREMGDLSENGAYKYAKFELRDTDKKLRHLNKLITYGVVNKSRNDGKVGFGSIVTLKFEDNEITYELVSGYESNPVEKKLSVYSPIGKAILNKQVGDEIEVDVPAGKKTYTILKIE